MRNTDDDAEIAVVAVIVVLVVGVSTTFWSLVGLGRVLYARLFDAGRRRQFPRHRRPNAPTFGLRRRWRAEHLRRRRWVRRPTPAGAADPPAPAEVAVLVAAHNEELVIAETIRTASQLVDAGQIHVVSDGSTDDTAAVAAAAGALVLEVNPNRGKAGALAAGIDHFGLCRRFEVVLLLDADTHLSPDYLTTGLPLFSDPDVVAVAGRARTIEHPAPPTGLGRFLIAYRERLYLIVQLLLKFGQAAKWANAVTIVPGFASMYRTSALQRIDVTGAGLVIEDFNMTFEIHAKRLGRIAFHPSAATAFTQDPDTLGEYVRQVRRWILGFWQTVRRHRFRTGVFWVALAVFIVELLLSSLMLVLLIPVLIGSMLATALLATAPDAASWSFWAAGVLTPRDVLIGVLLPDYLLTVMAAVVLHRPRYLLLGLGFGLMRIVDAALCLRTLPMAWLARSSGVWISPTRRVGPAPADTDDGRPASPALIPVGGDARLTAVRAPAPAAGRPAAGRGLA